MRTASILAFGAIVAIAVGCSPDSCPPCPDGQVCVDGECVAPACADECPGLGIFGCASPPQNGLTACADFDADPCLEWGGFSPCQDDASCADGVCTGGCNEECPTDGQLECVGDEYRECGEHDGDPCREWSSAVSCPPGETCSNGICSGVCADECNDGERTCDGDGFRSCGQHDSDACRDWSPVEPCGDGETCVGGQCGPSQCTEPWEDCTCGDDECCEGHCCPFTFVCVPWPPDEDVCF